MLLEQSFRFTLILIKHTFRDNFIKTIFFISILALAAVEMPSTSKVKSEENCAPGEKLVKLPKVLRCRAKN